MATAAGNPRGTAAWKRLCAQVYAEEIICHLCRRPVDQTLPRSHPMSRTVDHLDALVTGGAGIPSRHRVRLAHRRCNSARGNRSRAGTDTLHVIKTQW